MTEQNVRIGTVLPVVERQSQHPRADQTAALQTVRARCHFDGQDHQGSHNRNPLEDSLSTRIAANPRTCASLAVPFAMPGTKAQTAALLPLVPYAENRRQTGTTERCRRK